MRKMKKIFSVALACIMIFTSYAFVFASVKGDVDADGSVSSADARLALRYAVGLEVPTEDQKLLADYDENGTIDAADARSILRVAVGLDSDKEDEKPVVKPQKPNIPYVPSEREANFYKVLYETGHSMLGGSIPIYNIGASIGFPQLDSLTRKVQKWCCYYTIAMCFRPALEAAGYSKIEIDRLAPNQFSVDSKKKVAENLDLGWAWWVFDALWFLPSFLADYYIKTPEAADVYFLHDFYDDMVENKVYEHSDEDIINYEPRIGDILFMSNKLNTHVEIDGVNYPTVDHTAQIIEILDDGSFICTEGSLIDPSSNSDLAVVQERRYFFYEEDGTYVLRDDNYMYRSIVVLYAAQPHLR